MENTPMVEAAIVPKRNVLCEVTSASRVLTAVLFIVLPFVGFWLGLQYSVESFSVSYSPELANHQNELSPELTIPSVTDLTDNVTQATTNLSTATTTNEDGMMRTIVTAYVVSISPDQIELDYIDVFGGNEAAKQMVQDGICSNEQDCLIPGVPTYDRNISNKIYTFPFSSNIQILSDRGQRISAEVLLSAYSNVYDGVRHSRPVDVTFNSKGAIEEINVHFRP